MPTSVFMDRNTSEFKLLFRVYANLRRSSHKKFLIFKHFALQKQHVHMVQCKKLETLDFVHEEKLYSQHFLSFISICPWISSYLWMWTRSTEEGEQLYLWLLVGVEKPLRFFCVNILALLYLFPYHTSSLWVFFFPLQYVRNGRIK